MLSSESKQSQAQVQARIDTLVSCLNRYSQAYYIANEPLVSDLEFDTLFLELQHLEQRYPHLVLPASPTQRVGVVIRPSVFAPVAHPVMMLSLSNVFSRQELQSFHERVCTALEVIQVDYVAELKFDGLAVSLWYEFGCLVRTATRGDGRTGEDVTHSFATIQSVPAYISELRHCPSCIVRGEVLMHHRNFEHLNQVRQEAGERLFANARNAAAGSLRQLNPKIAAQRELSFYAYGLLDTSDGFINASISHQARLMQLRAWGMPVYAAYRTLNSVDALQAYYDKVHRIRNRLPFDIDGVVYKVNCQHLQARLGYVARAPRFAIAYKFEAPLVRTQVLSMDVQVGRTGVLTPIARLEPVEVGGVWVKNVSLYNAEEVLRKDIRQGDFVYIRRAGDVIPEVVRVDLSARLSALEAFSLPQACPVCGTTVVADEGVVAVRCPAGLSCAAQRLQRLMHFVSKPALNIKGLGEKVLQQLLTEGLVQTPVDLFQLKVEDLLELPRFGQKSAEKLVNEIARARDVSLFALIYALGIPHVGLSTAQELANAFSSLECLRHATQEALENVKDVGSTVAKAVVDFFEIPENVAVIHGLLERGILVQQVPSIVTSSGKLAGVTFVLTGTLKTFSREEAVQCIEQLGGRVMSSVSKNIDYVVVGENPGQKQQKAQMLGVATLDEASFIEQLQ